MSQNFPYQFPITIEKLLPGGEGLAHYQKWPVFVFGVLPGEEVLVQPAKKRQGSLKAAVLEVLKPSPHRREARDIHHPSSSPYQIMPEEMQYAFKTRFALEVFKQKADWQPLTPPELVPSPEVWHYRNKMEYCFTTDSEGKLRLALHKRNRKNTFYCVTEASIAHPKINELAQIILSRLQEKNISSKSLKSLVLRYSYQENKCSAALYVIDPAFSIFELSHQDLSGWLIIYSDPLSPASLTTKILFTAGQDYLRESIGGISLTYGYDGFFQTNPPAFNQLVSFIKSNMRPGKNLVELYSGVGTLSLNVANFFENIHCVESDPAATDFARENCAKNGIANALHVAGLAEKQLLTELLQNIDTLLVDPPRTGLHPKVIKSILECLPQRLVYVSCNPQTHAQDFALLKNQYTVDSWQLFDLYPQTPHLESVLILDRRSPK